MQENEDAYVAGISADEEVIVSYNEGGLTTMVCSEARLKGFIKVIVGHVLIKLGGDYPFQDFTEEGKVGDRKVVLRSSGSRLGSLRIGLTATLCGWDVSRGCGVGGSSFWWIEFTLAWKKCRNLGTE